VVFLVTLPLCLGIALASGAPLFSGILAGIVGGLVIAVLSDSPISVSGPAAGLTVIVGTSIQSLGSYKVFLAAVVIAGIIQFVLGLLKAGVIGDYVPNAVIKGMLAAIGLTIILKQIPHALGRDVDFEGDFGFLEPTGGNTITEIGASLIRYLGGALVISAASLLLLILWNYLAGHGSTFLRRVPGPLAVVGLGIGLNQAFRIFAPSLYLSDPQHMVRIPVVRSFPDFLALFTLPDFSAVSNTRVWTVALTLVMVASLETLLALEGADRLDPQKRISSPNRELRAQGVGNLISGVLGGLPVTSVVVRSSANASAGARSWRSSFIHGLLLLACSLLVPTILNLIPLACLAALLITVGYKLTEPKLYRSMYKLGMAQFLPFVITIGAILFTDLLEGVLIGLICAVFFVVRENHHEAITMVSQRGAYLIRCNKDMTFVNKSELRAALRSIPPASQVLIDGSRALYIDKDILEVVDDFGDLAASKNITVQLKDLENKGARPGK
jgi:MFS superfamily sulfate permease-like transporter